MLLKKHPRILDFIKQAYNEFNVQIKEFIIKNHGVLSEELKISVLNTIDYSYF